MKLISSLLLSLCSIALASGARNEDPVLPLQSHGCPATHQQHNRHCYHKGYQFSIKVETALTDAVLPDDENIQEEKLEQQIEIDQSTQIRGDALQDLPQSAQIPQNFQQVKDNKIAAHYVRLIVQATKPDLTVVPVPGIPLQMVPVERDQVIYKMDHASGEYTKKKIIIHERAQLTTNQDGVAAFSIPIYTNEDVKVQRLFVQGDFHGRNTWEQIHAHTGTFQALENIQASHLVQAKPGINQNEAEETAENIRQLSQHFLSIQKKSRPSIILPNTEDSSNGFFDMFHHEHTTVQDEKGTQVYHKTELEGDWEKLKHGVIRSIRVTRDAVTHVVKAIVKVADAILHLTIETIYQAFRVLYQLGRLFAIALVTVVDSIKFVLAWDAILDNQAMFVNQIKDLHEKVLDHIDNNEYALGRYIEESHESVVGNLRVTIDHLQEKTAVSQHLEATKNVPVAVKAVGDVFSSINLKNSQIEVEQEQISQVQVQLQEAATLCERFNATLAAGIRNAGNALAFITAGAIVTVLELLVLVVSTFREMLEFSADLVIGVFRIVFEIYYAILTFKFAIPIVTSLFSRPAPDGRIGVSLLELITFTPAVFYTYAQLASSGIHYLLSHHGARVESHQAQTIDEDSKPAADHQDDTQTPAAPAPQAKPASGLVRRSVHLMKRWEYFEAISKFFINLFINIGLALLLPFGWMVGVIIW